MGVMDFVKNGVGAMMIARPPDAHGLLAHRFPDRVPIYAQVEVAPGDSVVVAHLGTIKGYLGPGRHTLAPNNYPFLQGAIHPDGQHLDVELFFVSTQPLPINVGGSILGLKEEGGTYASFRLAAKVHVKVADPGAMVAGGVADLGKGIQQMLSSRLLRELERALVQLFKSGQLDARDLGRVGQALTAAAGHDALGMSSFGLGVAAVEVVHLMSVNRKSVEPPQRAAATEPAPPIQPAPAGGSPFKWGVGAVAFYDTVYEMPVTIRCFGEYRLERPVTPEQEDWVKNLVVHSVQESARTWTGSVLDLEHQKDEWASYVAQMVAPHVQYYLQTGGQLTIASVNMSEQEAAELRRRAGR